MGLNKEVRDFFTSRINRVLDARLKVVMQDVDTDEVESAAYNMFVSKYGGDGLLERSQKVDELRKQADTEEKAIQNELEIVFENAGESKPYWRSDYMSTVKRTASQEFKNDAMGKLYPTVVPELEKIAKLKDDVQGAVLLATTEPKLLKLLTMVLKNYGGDIDDLLEVLPPTVED